MLYYFVYIYHNYFAVYFHVVVKTWTMPFFNGMNSDSWKHDYIKWFR